MGKRQTGLLAIGCTIGLTACGNDLGGAAIDPPGDVEVTLSDITETPDDFDPAKLYKILHAQSDRLTVLHWDGTPRAYLPPEPPMSEEQIAATISGHIVMAHGGCDVAGDDHPGRWECVLMVNGRDVYGPGEQPADEGGEWAEQHSFSLRLGGDGEPDWVVDPATVDVQFAG